MYPLPPHSYPGWIKGGALISLILFLFSLKDIPHCCSITTDIRAAKTAFKQQNYIVANLQCQKLLKQFPKCKKLKLLAAKSLFQLRSEPMHIEALNLLKNISITKEEWKDLNNYMPQIYQQLFEDKKGKQS